MLDPDLLHSSPCVTAEELISGELCNRRGDGWGIAEKPPVTVAMSRLRMDGIQVLVSFSLSHRLCPPLFPALRITLHSPTPSSTLYPLLYLPLPPLLSPLLSISSVPCSPLSCEKRSVVQCFLPLWVCGP